MSDKLRLVLGHKGKVIDTRLINIMIGEIIKPKGLICLLYEPMAGHKKINFKVEDIEIKSNIVTLVGKQVGTILLGGCSINEATQINIPDINKGAYLQFKIGNTCEMTIIIPTEEHQPTTVKLDMGQYSGKLGQYIVHKSKPYRHYHGDETK